MIDPEFGPGPGPALSLTPRFTDTPKEPKLLLVKRKRRGPGRVWTGFMGWVGNEGVDINWQVRSVSSQSVSQC